MEYAINYKSTVNISNVEWGVMDHQQLGTLYECMTIEFDNPMYFPSTNGTMIDVDKIIIDLDYLEYTTKYFKESYYNVVKDIDRIIRSLLDGSLTDEEIGECIMLYYDGANDYYIKDIADKKIIKDLIKMIRKAMIDYQL